MTTPTLDSATFGLAKADPYGTGRASSNYVLRALKGRPRYRRKDEAPSYLFNVEFDWSDAQYGAFQEFWRSRDNGVDPFLMTLVMAQENPAGFVITDTVVCQARGAYSATSIAWGRWTVNFDVEVPHGTSLTGTACDVIYGGPTFLPANNDIWAGTPDAPATDIIEPCPAIIPPPVEEAA